MDKREMAKTQARRVRAKTAWLWMKSLCFGNSIGVGTSGTRREGIVGGQGRGGEGRVTGDGEQGNEKHSCGEAT